jgi:hypothetical protein
VAGGFFFALRLFPRRSLEALILAVAFVATGALFGWALFRARDVLVELGRPGRLAIALTVPLVAAGVAKLVANGLLGLAIRLARLAPRERLVSRRTLLGVLGGALGVVAVVALAWPSAERQAAPTVLPVAPGEAVALVGLDGILSGELDYLLARGALPAIAARLAEGGGVLRYQRSDEEEPAELWTTIATGVAASRHGVGAVDGYRPAGLASTLWRSGPWTFWWSRIAQPLGLAEHRPIVANRRRAFTFWEIAARGGAPVVGVNWWATWPARAGAGLAVAHGAYQLLAEDAPGAVAPPERTAELKDLAAGTSSGPFGATLAAALAPGEAEAALARAFLPDRFYLEVARRSFGARALAVYLPGIDLVAERFGGREVALADLVRTELEQADALVGALTARTVFVVVDPGRRGGGEGRAILLRPGCRVPGVATIRTVEVAATLARAVGLPQSAELPAPVATCPWPDPPVAIATFGEPRHDPDPARGSTEYLENLRSLGYL